MRAVNALRHKNKTSKAPSEQSWKEGFLNLSVSDLHNDVAGRFYRVTLRTGENAMARWSGAGFFMKPPFIGQLVSCRWDPNLLCTVRDFAVQQAELMVNIKPLAETSDPRFSTCGEVLVTGAEIMPPSAKNFIVEDPGVPYPTARRGIRRETNFAWQ